ncbi:N(6)-adenine-specific methyltransferase METTL4 [Esox lucius]|nr:N(6)-adenine-specific methyltransferase METTL4 [Esox lucius]
MMSVVFKNTNGWLLDACSLVNQGVQLCTSAGKAAKEKSYFKCCFKQQCFKVLTSHVNVSGTNDISIPDRLLVLQGSENDASVHFNRSKRRKRKRSEMNQGEIDSLAYHLKIRSAIAEGTKSLVDAGLSCGYLSDVKEENEPLPSQECNLAALCDMAKGLPLVADISQVQFIRPEDGCSTTHLELFTQVTESCMDCAVELTLMGQKYIIPPRCSFLLSDLTRIQPLVDYGKLFNLIVMDPPWENKSVKRSGRYGFLPSTQLKRLPIPLLAAAGCVVVTWVTNRSSHLRFVKDELYPHWGVEVLAEWFWVKVTNSGKYVFPLDSPHKKPYEVLVLGRYRGSGDDSHRSRGNTELSMEDQRVIVSVPSALHSHKPSLSDVLKPYAGADADCLELFARSLQPGWTSWGNEVIKFQHVSYYTVELTSAPTDKSIDEDVGDPTDPSPEADLPPPPPPPAPQYLV